ncbi:MAG: M48 family metalloprotease [Candidatus Hodarchaeales archaeon]|jgi:STE24 endopeptidase
MSDTGFESNGIHSEISEIETKISQPQLVTDFDPERRKLALSYTRTLRKFDFRLAIVSFIIMIFIIFSKVTVVFEDYITKNVSENQFLVVGIFYLLVFLFLSIIELPIAYYSLTRFSRKYGLTKLSNKQWFKRRIKVEIFSLILGLVVFEGFYWFLRTFPDSWWILGTITLILFSVILANLIPILILPRFYKFSPLNVTHPELAKSVLQLADQAGVKTTKVLNWKLGEIATVGNAALLGFGATRRIIIADTMLEKYTEEEIKWVVLHEIAHFKHRDLWRQILIGTVSTFLMLFLTHLSYQPLAEIFGYSLDISMVSGIPILGISFWVVNQVLLTIPSLWYSRRQEKAADLFASSYIKEKTVVNSLMMKMADQNLADINPPWWEKLLFMSHPPIKERLRKSN